MDPNNNSPQSDHADQRIESQSSRNDHSIPEGDSTHHQSESFSDETPRIQALESELHDKAELVDTLTERLTEVAEQLEKSQQRNQEKTQAENQKIKDLESCLLEEAELVETLKKRLGEVAGELERYQNAPQSPGEVDPQHVEELEAELQEKARLVAELTERLAEVETQLNQSQRENQELSAADNQRIHKLEAELEEKEQLVVILTERLEQVAEQLDRRHRTGADRGMTVSGGIPREFIEEQQKLSQDLQTVIEQWQGMQTEASLARIELQIAELKKMVEEGIEVGPAPAKPSSLVEYLSAPSLPDTEELLSDTAQDQPEAEPPAAAATDESDSSDDTVSGWEAMKQKLLSGQGVDISSELPKKPAQSPAPAKPAQQPVQPSSPLLDGGAGRTLASYKPPLPEAPVEFDAENATVEQLKSGISERDQYITLLIKRLREAESAVIPVDWELLNNAPEELVQHLQSLQKDLEHNLGLAEVEISIERARLSRTESMLQNREEQIRKKEKQLGLNQEREEDEGIPEEKQLNEDQKKRWLGFLN